jgi:hypothetical protein
MKLRKEKLVSLTCKTYYHFRSNPQVMRKSKATSGQSGDFGYFRENKIHSPPVSAQGMESGMDTVDLPSLALPCGHWAMNQSTRYSIKFPDCTWLKALTTKSNLCGMQRPVTSLQMKMKAL